MDRPYTINRLDHIVLRVRDLEKSIAFYTMVGGEVAGQPRAGASIRIAPGQSIILQGRPEYVPADLGSVDHINFMIKADDIDSVADYLRGNGATIVNVDPNGQAGPTVNVSDPDGYVLEIRIDPRG